MNVFTLSNNSFISNMNNARKSFYFLGATQFETLKKDTVCKKKIQRNQLKNYNNIHWSNSYTNLFAALS